MAPIKGRSKHTLVQCYWADNDDNDECACDNEDDSDCHGDTDEDADCDNDLNDDKRLNSHIEGSKTTMEGGFQLMLKKGNLGQMKIGRQNIWITPNFDDDDDGDHDDDGDGGGGGSGDGRIKEEGKQTSLRVANILPTWSSHMGTSDQI